MKSLIETVNETGFLGRLRAIQSLNNVVSVAGAATSLLADITERPATRLPVDDPVRIEVCIGLVELLAGVRSPEQTAQDATDLYGQAKDVLGERHQATQKALGAKTRYRRRAGFEDHLDAIENYRRVILERQQLLGPKHRKSSMARLNLAIALRDSTDITEITEAINIAYGEWQDRQAQYESELGMLNGAGVQGASDASVARALETYVRACIRRAELGSPHLRSADLLDIAARSEALVRQAHGTSSAETVIAQVTLARAHLVTGDAKRAIYLLASPVERRGLLDYVEADYVPQTQAMAWSASDNPSHWLVALGFAQTAIELGRRAWGDNTRHMQEARVLLASIELKVSGRN